MLPASVADQCVAGDFKTAVSCYNKFTETNVIAFILMIRIINNKRASTITFYIYTVRTRIVNRPVKGYRQCLRLAGMISSMITI